VVERRTADRCCAGHCPPRVPTSPDSVRLHFGSLLFTRRSRLPGPSILPPPLRFSRSPSGQS
jgi:hypothetical protein